MSDIGLLMDVLGLNNDKQQTTCIGIAAPNIPIEMSNATGLSSSSSTSEQTAISAAAE